ncbi:MAG TPA: hypothetical protein VH643_12740 [Gemmataceae bacterium]|jgi:hypothetical protein
MSVCVCLFANTISYLEGGGHFWVYLNWALGLRALGCRIIWTEGVGGPAPEVCAAVAKLKERLARYGLAEDLALWSWDGERVPPEVAAGCHDLGTATEADLLLNFEYFLPAAVVGQFRRSALVDIDPWLLQLWIKEGRVDLARHDVYFTTGETVGQPGSKLADGGRRWDYVPPCVALDWWPPCLAPEGSAFTTLSHWHAKEWVQDGDEEYVNDKRSGFLPFLDLPARTRQPLELALCLGDGDADDALDLRRRGWRVRESWEVASTPWDYQRYIQGSRGEFSCAKPSAVRMQNAWVSDRTLCYLASGKPAVVQYTGPSRFLPDAGGLFRFRTPEAAARHLETAAADYERQSRLARGLAEEYFDARKVAAWLLERALA